LYLRGTRPHSVTAHGTAHNLTGSVSDSPELQKRETEVVQLRYPGGLTSGRGWPHGYSASEYMYQDFRQKTVTLITLSGA
jgi:hypothetical protein